MNSEQKHSSTVPAEVKELRRDCGERIRQCGGHLRGHARGVKLEVLRCLQAMANRNADRIVWTSAAWFERKGFCTRRWVREVLKDLRSEGWISPVLWRERHAWSVRSHHEWAKVTGPKNCSLAEETSLKGEESSSPGGRKFPEKGRKFPRVDPKTDPNPSVNQAVTGGVEPPRKERGKRLGKREERVDLALFTGYGFEPNGTRYWMAVENKAASATWRTHDDKVVGVTSVGLVEHFDILLEALQECNWKKIPVHRSILDHIEKVRPAVEELRYEMEDVMGMQTVDTIIEELLTPADRKELARLNALRNKRFERIGPEGKELEEEVLNPSKMVPEDW